MESPAFTTLQPYAVVTLLVAAALLRICPPESAPLEALNHARSAQVGVIGRAFKLIPRAMDYQVALFQFLSKLSTVSKESRPHLFKFDQQAVCVGRVMP